MTAATKKNSFTRQVDDRLWYNFEVNGPVRGLAGRIPVHVDFSCKGGIQASEHVAVDVSALTQLRMRAS